MRKRKKKRLGVRAESTGPITPRRSWEPDDTVSWLAGLSRWLADHPIDYEHLDRYMGTHEPSQHVYSEE